MTTSWNEPSGIHAKSIEAENIVSGTQIQGGDAQAASALVQLAQAIQRGEIRAEEIKARNLVSGLQYIADLTQANVDDLRRELAAFHKELDRVITAQDILDTIDAEDATNSLATAESELGKPQPNKNRVLRKLDELSQIVIRGAETAESAGKLGSRIIQLAPVAAALWQIAQRILGG